MFDVRQNIFLIAVLAGCYALPSAHGTPIQYHATFSAWSDTVTDISIATFEGLAPLNGGPIRYAAAGLPYPGVVFYGLYGSQYQVSVLNDNRYPSYNWGSGAILQGPITYAAANSRIEARLTEPRTAVAFDLMTFATGQPVWVSVDSGEPIRIETQLSPNRTFWGLTSTEPVSLISLWTVEGYHPMLDNFRLGDLQASSPGDQGAESVPEPASLWLFGTGTVVLLLHRARRKGWGLS